MVAVASLSSFASSVNRLLVLSCVNCLIVDKDNDKDNASPQEKMTSSSIHLLSGHKIAYELQSKEGNSSNTKPTNSRLLSDFESY